MELGERDRWAYSVQNLGLELYFGPKYVDGAAALHFYRMKSALLPTGGAPREPGTSDWLENFTVSNVYWAHGGWNGSEVLCGIPFERVEHTHGTGEHAHTEVRDEPRTCVVARIEPSLMLGITAFNVGDLVSGSSSIDPGRTSALVAPLVGDGKDAGEQLRRAMQYGMKVRVSDTTVCYVADEIHSRDLKTMIDSAALVAQRLAYARGRLPPSAAEHAILTAWQSVASARGLSLNPASFTIGGAYGGYEVNAALYLVQRAYHTDVRVRLGRPLTEIHALEIKRSTTSDKIFGWLSSNKVDAGDSSLTVHGGPDAAVRHVLSPSTLPHVHALLETAVGVSLKGDALWVHFAEALDAAKLDRAFAEVSALAAIITPRPVAAPYR